MEKLKVLKAREAEKGKIYYDCDSQMYVEVKEGKWTYLWKPSREEETIANAEEILALDE